MTAKFEIRSADYGWLIEAIWPDERTESLVGLFVSRQAAESALPTISQAWLKTKLPQAVGYQPDVLIPA